MATKLKEPHQSGDIVPSFEMGILRHLGASEKTCTFCTQPLQNKDVYLLIQGKRKAHWYCAKAALSRIVDIRDAKGKSCDT